MASIARIACEQGTNSLGLIHFPSCFEPHYESETKGWFPYDRRSQIADRNKVSDRLRSYGNQPLDRTWFLSSAIVCDRDRRIADDRRSSFHMIADDRRPHCDLRSAISDHMETSLKCKGFVMKISFHSHANKTNFHLKSFAFSLAFTVRFTATRKWPFIID